MSAAPEERAEARGHVCKGFFNSAEHDLELAYAPNANIDGRFEATDLSTGDLIAVNGWLFICESPDTGDLS